MEEFFQWTAWPMEKPASYGPFHLTFFIVGVAVSVLLAYLLRKTNEKQNKIVLGIVGGFLLITEIYKQLFYVFVVGKGAYQWWIFPFQMCSIPMYFCLIAPFLKPGKIQNGMYNFMLAFNLMGGFVAFIEPSGLVHEYWTLTLHAFIWHMMLVFVGLYIGFSGRAGLEIKDYRYAICTFVILCVIAFAINLIFWKMPGSTKEPTTHINMFYIGPADSPLIVFKTICKKVGWYISSPLYIISVCIGAFIFYLPFTIYRKKAKKKV